MSVIMIYFILMPGHVWQFLTISEAPSLSYCEREAADIGKAFTDVPGNMRVICADDQRIAI